MRISDWSSDVCSSDLGRGWTAPGGRPHAEAMALGQAGVAAKGATVYVTLEPCAHENARGPPCAALLAAARPAPVVVGAGRSGRASGWGKVWSEGWIPGVGRIIKKKNAITNFTLSVTVQNRNNYTTPS